MWRANMRRSALNRERQTYSYTRFCNLCVRALILWSVPLPSYKVHHFSLSNWQTLFNLIIKRNFKLPWRDFETKCITIWFMFIHVIQVDMYQIDHVMWHWMVPVSISKEEDWVAVLWCLFTCLVLRAFWKIRRKAARLNLYMLLILARSLITKYILLPLSASGR